MWKRILQLIVGISGVVYAIITYKQWSDLNTHFEGEQRAWLEPTIQWPETPSTVPSAATLYLTNIGKSIIFEESTEVGFELLKANETPSFGLLPRHDISTGTLKFPTRNTKLKVDFMFAPQYDVRNFNTAEISDLLAGFKYIVVYGQSRYRDQFKLHWINFCFWTEYLPPPTYREWLSRPCVDFNSVGDGTPPPWPFVQVLGDPK